MGFFLFLFLLLDWRLLVFSCFPCFQVGRLFSCLRCSTNGFSHWQLDWDYFLINGPGITYRNDIFFFPLTIWCFPHHLFIYSVGRTICSWRLSVKIMGNSLLSFFPSLQGTGVFFLDSRDGRSRLLVNSKKQQSLNSHLSSTLIHSIILFLCGIPHLLSGSMPCF